jgi:hypothetical protein
MVTWAFRRHVWVLVPLVAINAFRRGDAHRQARTTRSIMFGRR